MVVNYSKLSQKERVNLLYSTVIPRPIAWIVTEMEGVVNIAPFSFFTGVSSTPPVVIVAIGNRKDGTPKDTLRNILETKKATICSVSQKNLEKMKNTGTPLPENISEADEFDIEVEKIEDDYPPVIKGVESAFFCKLHSRIEFEGNTTPVFLEIEKHFFRDEKFQDGFLSLDVIGRVGKTFAKLEKL